MEDYKIETLYDVSELFKVFGDTTRIRILTALRGGPLCVFHLAQQLEMGQSAISHQLRLLRGAGLVRANRVGKTVSYALDDDHVAQILDLGLAHVAHRKGGHDDE
ncbi:MAG: metalloregulator ArsR/SmtB family transcription factor [Oscillospiraceae bacterium]|jgi:ArsR family transcriptional regulator|nr:metalloregulator ArsR/SmtB family transcription factor [Oscillospiraceae bacterium]